MWEDEILEEIHKSREEHAKSFNYDIKAICEDWRKRQGQSGRKLVNLGEKSLTESEDLDFSQSDEVEKQVNLGQEGVQRYAQVKSGALSLS